jgi:hypothetical protein
VAAGASVIQGASPGEQSEFATRALTFVVGGAAAFFAASALFLALTNRRDPKLRSVTRSPTPWASRCSRRSARDRTHRQGWVELLGGYAPANVDGWHCASCSARSPPPRADPPAQPWATAPRSWSSCSACRTTPERWPPGRRFASFAASTGTTTQLVAAQPHESANALWAACSRVAEESDPRPALSVTTRLDVPAEGELTVRLAVLDGDDPEPDPRLGTGAVALLAVSAASSTGWRWPTRSWRRTGPGWSSTASSSPTPTRSTGPPAASSP